MFHLAGFCVETTLAHLYCVGFCVLKGGVSVWLFCFLSPLSLFPPCCVSKEMANGGELFDLLVEQGIPAEEEAATLMRALLGAVAFVHMHGIIHGDIKVYALTPMCMKTCVRGGGAVRASGRREHQRKLELRCDG